MYKEINDREKKYIHEPVYPKQIDGNIEFVAKLNFLCIFLQQVLQGDLFYPLGNITLHKCSSK